MKTFTDEEGIQYVLNRTVGGSNELVIRPKYQEPKRWRAKYGDTYWCVNTTPQYEYDDGVSYEDRIQDSSYQATKDYEAGNYFRTKEQAQAAAEAVKALFTYIQDTENRHNNLTDLNHLAAKASFAVQEDN